VYVGSILYVIYIVGELQLDLSGLTQLTYFNIAGSTISGMWTILSMCYYYCTQLLTSLVYIIGTFPSAILVLTKLVELNISNTDISGKFVISVRFYYIYRSYPHFAPNIM